jgi:hypothetical protein
MFAKLQGIIGGALQYGIGGPRLKANGANLEARNAGDTAFAPLRTAGPCRNLTNARRYGTSPVESWYLGSLLIPSNFSNTAAVANKLYLTPFAVEEYETLDRLAIRVSSGSAGSCRLGIYAVDFNTWAGSLVLDAGTVATTTTGAKTLAVATQIPPGWYALASVFDATPTIGNGPPASHATALGFASDLSSRQIGASASFTFGALPSDFSGLTLAAESSMGAHVFMRRSQ